MQNNKQSNENENENRKEILWILVFFIFSILSICLSILCLDGATNKFIERNFLLTSFFASGLICGLFVVSMLFALRKKELFIKTSISVYVFFLFCLLLIYIFQKIGFFKIVKDADSLQKYLQKAGLWMPLLYVLLQYLQVVVLPIPSIVSTVAGVAIFGAFWAMIYSIIGILLGSITAFFIGRKLGNKAVVWLVGKETLEKWQKKLKGKDNLFLTIMFVLPLFPDDVLCFIAGLSSMSTSYFLIMVLLSRILAVVATCYSVDFIPFNTWWGITFWIVFITIIILSFIWIYKNMDKIQKFLKRKR